MLGSCFKFWLYGGWKAPPLGLLDVWLVLGTTVGAFESSLALLDVWLVYMVPSWDVLRLTNFFLMRKEKCVDAAHERCG